MHGRKFCTRRFSAKSRLTRERWNFPSSISLNQYLLHHHNLTFDSILPEFASAFCPVNKVSERTKCVTLSRLHSLKSLSSFDLSLYCLHKLDNLSYGNLSWNPVLHWLTWRFISRFQAEGPPSSFPKFCKIKAPNRAKCRKQDYVDNFVVCSRKSLR